MLILTRQRTLLGPCPSSCAVPSEMRAFWESLATTVGAAGALNGGRLVVL